VIRRLDDVIRGRPIIACGTPDYIARAVRPRDLSFDDIVDPRDLDRLAGERRDVAILVFARFAGVIMARLQRLGFARDLNVFDARFFGLGGAQPGAWSVLADTAAAEASSGVTVFLGIGGDLRVDGVMIQAGPGGPVEINCGSGASVTLAGSILEDRVLLAVANGGRLEIAAGAHIRTGTRITVGVNACVRIGADVLISEESIVDAANDVEIGIGDESTFGPRLNVFGYERIQIGRDCMFSSSVYVESGAGHDITVDGVMHSPVPVSIGDRVWVGMNACILAGGSLGAGSVVGAMSVVTRMFDDRSLVVGNPARVLSTNVTWARDYTAYKARFGRR